MLVNNEVSIRLGDDLMTLFHLGYISEDLAKVLILTHSGDISDNYEVRRRGGASFYDPLDIRRNDRRFKEHIDLLKIARVEAGSIEIVLAGATLLSSIVVPLVVMRAQQIAIHDEITLEVRCSHPLVQPLLDRYTAGEFGNGPDALNTLFESLKTAGIDVSPRTADVFVITSIVERYANRIAKTVKVRRS